SEDHAVEQPRVGRRRGTTVLGGESYGVSDARPHPPRHRDLGDVEVLVGHRDQNGGDHPTLEDPRAGFAWLGHLRGEGRSYTREMARRGHARRSSLFLADVTRGAKTRRTSAC